MAADLTPENIMAQAQALIEQVQRDLDAGEALYSHLGPDPQSARAALHTRITPELQAQVDKAIAQDLQDIEQKFQEELARNGSSASSKRPKATRRPRFMV